MLTSKAKEEIRELAEDMVSVKDCKTFLMQSDGDEFKKLGEVLILDLSVFSEGGDAKGAVRTWLVDCIEEAFFRSGLREDLLKEGHADGMKEAFETISHYQEARRVRLHHAVQRRDNIKAQLAEAEHDVVVKTAEVAGLGEAMEMLSREIADGGRG